MNLKFEILERLGLVYWRLMGAGKLCIQFMICEEVLSFPVKNGGLEQDVRILLLYGRFRD